MAIVTLAFRAGDFPAQRRSGYLVPAVDGRAVKAATFSTVKWPHLAAQAPVHVVRCSVGRSGDVAVLQRDDEDLAALAAAELAAAVGMTAKSVAERVTRWGGGLPQYNVGHLDRVAAHPRGGGAAARPGRRGRRLRRHRHPRVRRDRQVRRRPGERLPESRARGRRYDAGPLNTAAGSRNRLTPGC